MEDIFKFLLVIGIIVISFVRQTKKEAKKKADNTPVMPVPEVIATPKKAKKKYTPVDISSNQSPSPASDSQEANEQSEFEIHSVGDARRAIIWSEILQRKY